MQSVVTAPTEWRARRAEQVRVKLSFGPEVREGKAKVSGEAREVQVI